MASSTHEGQLDYRELLALPDFAGAYCVDAVENLKRDNRTIRAAFYRTLMRLDLRYTIYENDVVVIERPLVPDIVVDLSTGRVENAEG